MTMRWLPDTPIRQGLTADRAADMLMPRPGRRPTPVTDAASSLWLGNAGERPAPVSTPDTPTLTSGHHPDDGTTGHSKTVDVPATPWHETKNQRDARPASTRSPSAQHQGRATTPPAGLNGVTHSSIAAAKTARDLDRAAFTQATGHPVHDDGRIALTLANYIAAAVYGPQGEGR